MFKLGLSNKGRTQFVDIHFGNAHDAARVGFAVNTMSQTGLRELRDAINAEPDLIRERGAVRELLARVERFII